MQDSFKASESVELPDDADLWRIAEVATLRMRSYLEQMSGRVVDDGVRVRTTNASILTRPTFDEAKRALDEHDLAPSFVAQYQRLVSASRDESGEFLVEIITWAWFRRDLSSTRKLDIDIASSEKVTTDGLAAAAAGVLRRIKEGSYQVPSANVDVPATIVDGPRPPPTSVPETRPTAADLTTTARTAADPPMSWLRRTWRDHTAKFVVTVIGTVVAGLLLAWWGIGVA